MTTDEAIDKLLDERCPLDDKPVLLSMDFDSTWMVWYECPDQHTWRAEAIGRDDYAPDRAEVECALEQYTAATERRTAQ